MLGLPGDPPEPPRAQAAWEGRCVIGTSGPAGASWTEAATSGAGARGAQEVRAPA